MDEDKKFCEKCGQRLFDAPKTLFGLKPKEPTYFEFKDGYYCVKCAKSVVEDKRNNK